MKLQIFLWTVFQNFHFLYKLYLQTCAYMQVFKALSDETRYLMTKILLEEDRKMCICEFEAFFEKDSSVLYRNIKKMEEAGIVSTSKDGRKLFADIKDKEAVNDLISAVERIESDLPIHSIPEKVTS